MDVIGQYYAPAVKSKKERVTSKDKVADFDAAHWDEYDIRLRRRMQLEKRLAALRLEEEGESKTPVYRSKTAAISSWIGNVAVEQDVVPSTSDKAAHAYASLNDE